mgnify:CR=1 FL=1
MAFRLSPESAINGITSESDLTIVMVFAEFYLGESVDCGAEKTDVL